MTAPITYVALTSFEETPRTLVLAAPDAVTWNQGIQETIINECNSRGEMVFVEAIVNQKEPGMQISYAKMTKELWALKLGWKLEDQAITDALYCKSFRASKASYAGAASGSEGFGMTADQVTSTMYVLRNGITVPLTRAAFATFDGATDDTYAQGANAAIKLSDNIVEARELVTPVFYYPSANADVMIPDPFDRFRATFLGVITLDKKKRVFELVFDEMEVNRTENSQIDFKASPMQFSFRIIDNNCAPRFRFLGAEAAC
jgi:hypothetical protein